MQKTAVSSYLGGQHSALHPLVTVLRQAQLLHTASCSLPGPALGRSISIIKSSRYLKPGCCRHGRACQYTTHIPEGLLSVFYIVNETNPVFLLPKLKKPKFSCSVQADPEEPFDARDDEEGFCASPSHLLLRTAEISAAFTSHILIGVRKSSVLKVLLHNDAFKIHLN